MTEEMKGALNVKVSYDFISILIQDGGLLIAVGLVIVIVAAIVRNPVLIMCSVVSNVSLSIIDLSIKKVFDVHNIIQICSIS